MEGDFLEIWLTTFYGVRNFGKTSAIRMILFFQNIQDLIKISKVEEQIEKNFFVSGMIASDRLSEVTSIKKGILAIASQYVNKHS